MSLKLNYDEVVPHLYVIRIIGLTKREKLIKLLSEKGIEAGFHYQPNHWLNFFSSKNDFFPVSENIFPEIISLPLHPDLSYEDILYVVDNLKSFLEFILDE